MPDSRPSVARLCIEAAAAWLLCATVFLTVGTSARPASVASHLDHSAPSTVAGTTEFGLSEPGGTIGQATKVWSLKGFANDLRKPRPPRQRSERPTTGTDGVVAMLSASMLWLILCIDVQRMFVAEADDAGPLAGHYRSLLRPPSLVS